MSDKPLHGQTALVSGGTSGIGRATALALANQGASVAVTYHRDAVAARDLENAVGELGDVKCLAIQADAGLEADAARVVETVTEKLGSIDILVNNVGEMGRRTAFVDCEPELLALSIRMNLTSAFLLCRLALPGMLDRGFGAIVNVSAYAAKNGGAGNGSIHYAIAKAGLEAMTIGLARDYAPQGIRVNAVQPGLVDTPLHLKTKYDEAYGSAVSFVDRVSTLTPMKRAAAPEEIAAVIAFLASPAASYVTGAIVPVAGGL